MPSAERIARQIAFLVECDRLKDNDRQTLNAHSGRPENDSENTCSLCLFFMTLYEHSNTQIDVLLATRQRLCHSPPSNSRRVAHWPTSLGHSLP
jgi:putative hydrolase of HD superfamily